MNRTVKPEKKYCLVDLGNNDVVTPLSKDQLESRLAEMDEDGLDISDSTIVVDLSTGKKYEAIVTKKITLSEIKESTSN